MEHRPWDGKSYGTPLGYAIFVVCLRLFGLRFVYILLIPILLYYYLFRTKSTSSSHQFRTIYNFWPAKLRFLGRWFAWVRIYRFGQVMLDRIAVFLDLNQKFSLTHNGVAHLTEIAASGGILLGSHLGNWEAGLAMLKVQRNFAVGVVMMPVAGDWLQTFVKTRGQEFLTLLSLQPGETDMLAFKQQLESGNLIAMHGDRFLPKMRTVTVDFLGQPAQFPIGPYIVAAALQKPIAFVAVVKTGTFAYELICSKPRHYTWDKSRPRDEQLQQWVRDYAQFQEELLKQYPEQWFNFYDFWDV